MSDRTSNIVDNGVKRLHSAKEAFRVSEIWFKYASWLLTLGAIKLAAELTHSRALGIVAFMLTWQFWYPIGYFIVAPNLDFSPTWRNIVKAMLQMFAIFVLGYFVNIRLNVIVDALVGIHIPK